MNVLIVSYLFPPIINPQGILSARLAKYFNRFGHQVTVIAAENIDSYGSTHGMDNELLGDLKSIDIIYVRDKKRVGIIHSLKSKIVYHENYGYWVNKVMEIAIPICKTKNIDIIYSLSAPLSSNITGMKLKLHTKIPWISHFSDPTILALGLKFKSPLRTYFTYTDERSLLKFSDGITFVNEDTLLKTTRHDKKYREKCIILPHFYDPDYYTEGQKEITSDSIIKFTYVGSLYGRRNPYGIIAAFRMLIHRHPELEESFEFHLYGIIDPEILKLLIGENIKWLNIHGAVSYKESIRAMQCCNFLLLIDMPNADNMFTPSKLIDYLAADKPIIGITPINSNSSKILNTIPYPVFEPGDVMGLSNCFHNLILCPQPSISANHKIVTDIFKVDNIVTKLVELMDKILAEHAHG